MAIVERLKTSLYEDLVSKHHRCLFGGLARSRKVVFNEWSDTGADSIQEGFPLKPSQAIENVGFETESKHELQECFARNALYTWETSAR